MASKKVAVEGDVQATAGSTLYTGADSGTWTADSVTYSSYDKLRVSGGKVIYKAQCIFNFSGTNSAGSSVIGSETVTLEAGATKLQGSQSKVLVDSDLEEGTYGNKLQVQASNNLLTT